jgi:cell division initiation protein
VIHVAIRPSDVRRKEFGSGFRGYDANEVDDFLDEVADEFERAFSENRRLTEEVTALRGRLEQFDNLEDSIRAALVHAEQAARDLRQNASKEAELIVREAQERSHRILADSSSRVERVQESYEVLRKAKQEFANDFRSLLKSYIAVLDNIDVASAKEIDASLRERLDLESVAAAREAAETRRLEEELAPQQTDSMESDAAQTGDTEIGDTIQPVETTATPSGGTYDTAPGGRGPQPEVEEPEVEPSSAESPSVQERASKEAAAAPGPSDAATEVDREESMPTREGRVADEFFDRGAPRSEPGEEERKLFRASRFLRRRE